MGLAAPVTFTRWIARLGQTVVEGDRLLEVHSHSVSIDLPAPATGKLLRTLVSQGDQLRPGQRLGVIEEEPLQGQS